MNSLLRPLILAAAVLAAGPVFALESNFQAKFLVYGSPGDTPSVAYEVPAGQNLSYFTGREVADDVILSGTNRIIAGVSFEYYANYALAGGLTFRIYERTEAGVPGAMVYSLPLDILDGGGIVDISFNYDALNVLPQRFFYSVQFDDVEQGNVAGMMVPDRKATTGFSSDQLMEKRGNHWLPVDLTADRGLRLGLTRDGNKFRVWVVGTPNSLVKIESGGDFGGTWAEVAEVETDASGYAEYEEDVDDRDIVFFRTVSP